MKRDYNGDWERGNDLHEENEFAIQNLSSLDKPIKTTQLESTTWFDQLKHLVENRVQSHGLP